jgi:hypothetical protein
MPLSYEQILEMQQRLRVLQSRADEVFQAWGERAPAPTASAMKIMLAATGANGCALRKPGCRTIMSCGGCRSQSLVEPSLKISRGRSMRPARPPPRPGPMPQHRASYAKS